jgi:Carbohydrate esterase, sialic acid-specific acetylesterase
MDGNPAGGHFPRWRSKWRHIAKILRAWPSLAGREQERPPCLDTTAKICPSSRRVQRFHPGTISRTAIAVYLGWTDVFVNWNIIQEQQGVSNLPCSTMIVTNDLPLKDAVHFTTESYQLIGQRYAEALIRLKVEMAHCGSYNRRDLPPRRREKPAAIEYCNSHGEAR